MVEPGDLIPLELLSVHVSLACCECAHYRNIMYLRSRSRKVVLLALVALIPLVYAYFEGYVVMSKWISRNQRSNEKVCPVPQQKKIGSPLKQEAAIRMGLEDAKKPSLLPTRNDWSKDCINIKITDDERCLRKLDLSEQMDCDTPCQQSIQEYRKLNTRRACNGNSQYSHSSIWYKTGKLKPEGIKRLHHLIPIENSKIIFCYIPKDGCTAWKRILLTVAGHISSPSFQTDDIHLLFKTKLKSLASYKRREAEKRLKTYKKFVFVREPLERMLSLFLDKAVKTNYLHFNESQYEDFLKFIIKQPPVTIPTHFKEHWTHASNLCLPCDVSYDFIGRLETSKRDTQYIFDHFNLKNRDRLTMYHEENHPTNSSDSDKKNRYYQQVSKDVLKKAIEKYHRDYVLFNYDKPTL